MAGTVVLTSQRAEGVVRQAVITITGDASDGTAPATTLRSLGIHPDGTLLSLETNPGSPAPDANYDITLIDGDGLDRFNGAALNRSSGTSERVHLGAFVSQNETLTLTLANNATVDAVTVLTLTWVAAAIGTGKLNDDGTLPVADADVATALATLDASVTPDIGEVTFAPTLDTSAYAALDAMHTTSIELENMAQAVGGSGVITALRVIDADDQGAAGVMHIFTAATTQTANSAFAPSDAEAATYVGSITFGPWEDFNTSRASFTRAWLTYTCDAADTSLYAVLQTFGTPTHTASGISGSVTRQRFS